MIRIQSLVNRSHLRSLRAVGRAGRPSSKLPCLSRPISITSTLPPKLDPQIYTFSRSSIRFFSSSNPLFKSEPHSETETETHTETETAKSASKVEVASDGSDSTSSPIGEIKPKLSLTFTCTVTDCGTRSTHEFTRQAYTKGIVIVQCPGCKNRHLIADHLGWFKDSTEPRTVEEIVASHGGRVRRGVALSDGAGGETIEIEGEGEPIDGKTPRENL